MSSIASPDATIGLSLTAVYESSSPIQRFRLRNRNISKKASRVFHKILSMHQHRNLTLVIPEILTLSKRIPQSRYWRFSSFQLSKSPSVLELAQRCHREQVVCRTTRRNSLKQLEVTECWKDQHGLATWMNTWTSHMNLLNSLPIDVASNVSSKHLEIVPFGLRIS